MFSILENFGRVFMVKKKKYSTYKNILLYIRDIWFWIIIIIYGTRWMNRLLLYTVAVVFLPIEFPVEYPSYH